MSSFFIKTVVSFEIQFLHKFDMKFLLVFCVVMLLLVFPFGKLKINHKNRPSYCSIKIAFVFAFIRTKITSHMK